MENNGGYRRILVATEFSEAAEAAVRQAVWVARQSGAGASIVFAHVLPDFREAVLSVSIEAKRDLFYGGGERFQREVRQQSDQRLQQLISDLHATDLAARYETLLGAPYAEIVHAVQKENYDAVFAGTRGKGAWEQFFLGSTVRRLIKACPSSVWVVKAEHSAPPQTVLAATDFSDVSRRAALEGLWIARRSSAQFHLLHVISPTDVSGDLMETLPAGGSSRHEIDVIARKRLEQFAVTLSAHPGEIQLHLTWGPAWKEIGHLAQNLNADLIAMGTVGHGGLQGWLLGTTAERVMNTCDCSLLTVKPTGFVSPILPPTQSLHPAWEQDSTAGG